MASRLPTAADVRQVAPASIPGLRASPESFGSQVAQAQKGLGDAAFDLGVKMLDQSAELEAKKADNAIAKQIQQRLFGNEEGKHPTNSTLPGYYFQLRSAAAGGRGLAETEIRGYYDTAVENMSPRARRKFDTSALRRINTALDGIGRHALRENAADELEASVAREEQAISDAAAHAGLGDDAVAKGYAETAKIEAGKRARKLGSRPEVIKHEMAKALTKAHVAIIKKLLGEKGGAVAAGEWYKKYKVDILGTERADLEKAIKGGTQLQRVQQLGDEIMDIYNGEGGTDGLNATIYSKAKGDETWAMERAREGFKGESAAELKKNPELRKALVAHVKGRIAEIGAFEKAAKYELRLSAIQKVITGKEDTLTNEEREAMIASPGGWNFLLTGGAKAKAARAGRGDEGDPVFLTRVAKMTDPELAALDFSDPDVVKKLGKEYKKWLEKHRGAVEAMRTGVETRSVRQVSSDNAKLIKNQKHVRDFVNLFDAEIKKLVEGKGKNYKLPSEDAQIVADKLLLQMKSKSWYGGTKRRFRIPAGQLSEYTIDDKITDDRAKDNVDELGRILGIDEAKIKDVLTLLRHDGKDITLRNLGGDVITLEQARARGVGNALINQKRHKRYLADILGIEVGEIQELVETMIELGKDLSFFEMITSIHKMRETS